MIKHLLKITIGLSVVLVLSGCSGGGQKPLPTPTPPSPSPTPIEVVSAPVSTDTVAPVQPTGGTAPTEAPPTLPVSDLPEPTATQGLQFGGLGFTLGAPSLKASDIQSVNLLDGGKPKIVEFFAFW